MVLSNIFLRLYSAISRLNADPAMLLYYFRLFSYYFEQIEFSTSIKFRRIYKFYYLNKYSLSSQTQAKICFSGPVKEIKK